MYCINVLFLCVIKTNLCYFVYVTYRYGVLVRTYLHSIFACDISRSDI